MGRIKQGLDYFPLSTDFMHDRIVRRVMKREGDSAFAVLLYILSYLYSGEGYYVRADKDFCDELADQLFTTDNDAVRRIIHLFLEYGLFDSALFERYRILTSADIQRQYLFITKRRNRPRICQEYCLLSEEERAEAVKPSKPAAESVAATPDTVTISGDTVTLSPATVTKNVPIKRKEKEIEKKENFLPNPPSTEGGDLEERRSEGGDSFELTDDGNEGEEEKEKENAKTPKKKREWTQEDIDSMQAPTDGCRRNFSGLLENLRLYRIPPVEQYAIILKSNYGQINGEVWKGFSMLRGSAGKIKLPGRYLLSLLNK